MFDVLYEINWLAVFLATLAYFVLGAVWFTPLFGKAYDKGIGIQRSPKQKWPAIYYIGPFLSSLAVTVASAILVYSFDLQRMTDAVTLGSIIGVGYLASISLSNAITPNMPRPLLFGAVVGSYHLVGVTLVTLILYGMKG
jgi:hypothetical protein